MSHWYAKDGTPTYTVIGTNGKERDTTLRDARKLKLVPSVTTIIGQIAKPQLDRWKALKLLEEVERQGSLSHMLALGEDWKNIIIAKSNENNAKYSREGTRIHDALELYFKEGTVEPENEDILIPVLDTIKQVFGEDVIYEAEPSFAHSDGFGGKIDLVIHCKDGKRILDFKTKQGDKLDEKSCYFDYALQLAAYRKNYNPDDIINCGNILISMTNIGEHYIHLWSDSELDRAEQMFYTLLKHWQLANKYE